LSVAFVILFVAGSPGERLTSTKVFAGSMITAGGIVLALERRWTCGMDTEPTDVPFEFLDTRLIIRSTIILDVDGTITADAKTEISAGVARAIQSLAGRNAVYLFSNHSDGVRNRALARDLGLEYIDTPHRKPSRKIIEAIPAHHRVQPMIVIGDKIMIDGLFARRIGAQFIKVGRILSPSDRTLTKVAYFLDDLVSWLGARRGLG
jgi:predicted HAD superfamily phosphohydrolase YqeG